MTTVLAAFAIAFITAVVCTPVLRAVARRLGIVDKPDGLRKVHGREVPLLGGVAIYIALAAPIIALYFIPRTTISTALFARPAQILTLMGGGAIALAFGMFDDVRHLSARWKLLLQSIAALVAIFGGYSIKSISNPFGAEAIELGLLSMPITLFWFLGCMNAVNLVDGLDGLAAGVCLFLSLTLLMVSLFAENYMSMLLMACLSGSILGFLLFNFHPASIFLGDSGTMLLGYIVAALALVAAQKAEASVALLIPVIALGFPIFETALSMLRRWSRKLPISAADRQHIHHVLRDKGLSHKRAVLVLYAACAILGAAAILVSIRQDETTMMVIGTLGIIAFVCVRVFGGLRFDALWGRLSEQRDWTQRSVAAKIAVENAAQRMQAATDVETMWAACSDAFEALELDHATLRINGHNGSEPIKWTWSNWPSGDQSSQLDFHIVQLSIRNNGTLWGALELRKHVLDQPMLPVAPELLAKLQNHMGRKVDLLLIPE